MTKSLRKKKKLAALKSSTGPKQKSHYKQKAKIGDKVIALETGEIGVIKQIDNVCNLRDNNRSVNEYYVKWKNDAWTRHDCYYLDMGLETVNDERIVHLTGVTKILYGQKN